MAAPPGPLGPLPLGQLGRPHGVRGEIVFRPHNAAGRRLDGLRFPFQAILRPDRRHPGGPVPSQAEIASARPFGEGALLRLTGVSDRDQAARYTNLELCVQRELLPPLASGEIYVADLIGCLVLDQHGRARGRVTSGYWNGQHDVLEIRDEAGAELLIPAIPDFLREVDLPGARVVIDDHE